MKRLLLLLLITSPLIVTANTTTTFLEWDKNPAEENVTAYNVNCDNVTTFNVDSLIDTGATHKTPVSSFAQADGNYTCNISAININGEGGPSGNVDFFIKGGIVYLPPTGVPRAVTGLRITYE